MRIAIVSDIHGNLAALEAVIADMTDRKIDTVVNLGDSLSGPLLPSETANLLMETGWLHLAGNHERQLLECASGVGGASDLYARSALSAKHLQWVASLAPHEWLNSDVFLCHGTPSSDHAPLLESIHFGVASLAPLRDISSRLTGLSAGLVCCGHTHMPRVVHALNGLMVVNPGSVGLPAYLDTDPEPYRVENGSPAARYAIARGSGSTWVIDLISVSYDFKSMARIARKNGRLDWEFALLTGYVGEG